MAAGQGDQKFWILGVDDEPQNLEILEEILGDQFDLTLVSSGRACLDEANTAPPDLILLDVNMQGMDGLEVCRRLKGEPDTSDIPVIFVSAYSKLEERLAGYRAGGDDYVTKPFDDEELLIKVKLALATKRQLDSLQRSSTDALDVAQTALSVSGEAEALLHFLGAAYPLNSRADLGKSMLDMFECYGLRVVLRIEGEEGDLYLSHEGDVGPLEQEVLEMGPDDGRFIDFGRRTLAKYGGVSVLIRNMPVEDTNRHARWKKNLEIMLQISNARVVGINNEQRLQRQGETLLRMQDLTRSILSDMRNADDSSEGLSRSGVERVIDQMDLLLDAIESEVGQK